MDRETERTQTEPFKYEVQDTSRPYVNLSPRLLAVADFVRAGSRIADVGTDHAWLPIHLVTIGRIASAVATDVAVGPMRVAQRNVALYGLASRISTRLGYGLEPVACEEVDTVTISGMGGSTIVSILERSRRVVDGLSTLILQPMNAHSKVRQMLDEWGFPLVDERIVIDDGRMYTVLMYESGGGRGRKSAGQDEGSHECTWSSGVDPYAGFRLDRIRLELAYEFGPVLWKHPTQTFVTFVCDVLHMWERIVQELNVSDSSEARVKSRNLSRKIVYMEQWLRSSEYSSTLGE